MVKFGPTSTVIVRKGTVGFVDAGLAIDVPISIKFSLEGVAAGWANGVEYTAIVPFTEIKANHGFDLLDDGSTNISTAKRIGGLVHEAVNETGHKELTVKVLRLE